MRSSKVSNGTTAKGETCINSGDRRWAMKHQRQATLDCFFLLCKQSEQNNSRADVNCELHHLQCHQSVVLCPYAPMNHTSDFKINILATEILHDALLWIWKSAKRRWFGAVKDCTLVMLLRRLLLASCGWWQIGDIQKSRQFLRGVTRMCWTRWCQTFKSSRFSIEGIHYIMNSI